MRYLFLMRGLPGSGKSTILKGISNQYKSAIISADEVRQLFNMNILNPNGSYSINGNLDKEVWKFIFNLIEKRMQRGETLIIDATHYKTDSIRKYKSLCSQYQYDLQVIDMELAYDNFEEYVKYSKYHNSIREEYKKVPVEVIDRMAKVIEEEDFPSSYKRLSPKEFLDLASNSFEPFNYNQYEKVVIFGDIHGCLDPLVEYFKDNPFDPNYKYIFVGDYLDRGIQNGETFKFLMRFVDMENVDFLEGNHERWLRKWYKQELNTIHSKEFLNNTSKQIKDIPLEDIRHFVKRLKLFRYFEFAGRRFMVSHGGIPCLPNIFLTTQDLIDGVGEYRDSLEVDQRFFKTTDNNTYYQIHGHRNVESLPTFLSQINTFNLEGKIEFGGELRIVELSGIFGKDPFYKVIEIKNNTYRDPNSMEEIIKGLQNSRLVREKALQDNIHSFNFTKECMFDKKWSSLNMKARGLFMDMDNLQIMARGYDKFFNLGEVEQTKPDKLAQNLKFPVTAYRKENGYLGILAWNYKKDDFFIASKSTNEGDYAQNFRRILVEKYDIYHNESLLKLLKEGIDGKRITLLFEVIDPKFDPHIIKYDKEKVVLLDIVANDFTNDWMPYKPRGLVDAGIILGFEVKEYEASFNTWKEIEEFLDKNKDIRTEGWVFTDQDHFRFKVKSSFYIFWKAMRNNFLRPKNMDSKLKKQFEKEFEYCWNYPEEEKGKYIEDGQFRIIKFYEDYYRKGEA